MRRGDIEAGLRQLGLGEGDTVLLHSSLSSLGEVEGGAEAVVEAFLSVLGATGTLVVPTFGDLGVVTRVVAGWPGAVASIHPKASVAAIGAAAEAICRDHWKAETAHGAHTPYVRMADLGGYVCLLGVDQDRSTTLHTVEVLLEMPYLKTTEETCFATPEEEATRSWRHFPGPHRDFIGLDRRLREAGLVQVGRIGPAVVRLMKSGRVIDYLLEVGRADPAFALCDNPRCPDCLKQRAAIRRHRTSEETFMLVSAASLAGPSVPEILTACDTAGIAAVELDGLDGRGVLELGAAAVKEAAGQLRRGGCEVVALRCEALPGSSASLVDMAGACGVKRLVVPLGPGVGALAEVAAKAGVHVSAYNTTQRGEEVWALLSGWRETGLMVGLTFSPAAFARVGEKPFLESYRQKLKRFVDQLEVEDGTFDGRAALLAQGNGEIVELVSILRCSSFDGYLSLSASNRSLTDLPQTTSSFLRLIESL